MDVKKTIDNVATVLKAVSMLTGSDVLVGVPQEKTGRSGKEPINNAALAYIHEFGEPRHNIPARPFLYPGIAKAQPQIVELMRKGAVDALHGKVGAVEKTLNAVGMVARNSVVREITDPDPAFQPLTYRTVRARMRRTQAMRRKLTQINKKADKAGASRSMALMQWAGAGNVKPLLDTLQLRSSISYVVRKV